MGPGNVAGHHLRGQVVHRAAADRRLETIGLPDDPGGQVAAIGAARDAQPLGVGEAIADERVNSGEDVAHRSAAPIAKVGGVEVLPVTLGAARVGVVNADAFAGKDLEFPEGRPAVQGMRTAVDLGHERSGTLRTATGGMGWRDEPALHLTPIDGDPALDGLDEADTGQGVAVELGHPPRRDHAARRGLPHSGRPRALYVKDVDIRQLGRRGSDVCQPGIRPEALDLTVARRDPPQLVRAAVRRREGDPSPVIRDGQTRILAHRQVAVHGRPRHQIVPARKVSAATTGVGPVRGEEPHIAAAACIRRIAMAEQRNRLSVG